MEKARDSRAFSHAGPRVNEVRPLVKPLRRRSKMVGTTQLLVVIAGGVVAGLEALMGLRAHLQSNKRQSDAFGSER